MLISVVLLFPGRVDPHLRRRAAPQMPCPLAGVRTRAHQAGPQRGVALQCCLRDLGAPAQ